MEKRSRIDVAREAMLDILPEVTKSRHTGLVVYGPGGTCHVETKLQPAANAAQPIMDELARIKPGGTTPLGLAVSRAAAELSQSGVIVLVTDGEENCGINPCLLGQQFKLRSPGLIIYVIGVQMGARDEVRASCLATETGGTYVSARSLADIKQALREALTCPRLSRLEPPQRAPQTRLSRTVETPLFRPG